MHLIRRKNIGTEDMAKSFAAFQDLKYNRPSEWESMKDFKLAITHGNISPLVSLSDYNAAKETFNRELVGLVTADGIQLQSYSKHFVVRYFGSVAQRRSGVELREIHGALSSSEIQSQTEAITD